MKQLTILIAFGAGSSFAQDTTVNRDTIWFESVKREPMVRSVRGLGTVANRTTVELKLPEGQISEVRAGQAVTVDPQEAPSAKGRVTRVDPAVNGMATVAVGLLQDTSAAPGTSVDGTIELERLNDAVYVGRPIFGKPNSEGTLFKVDADGLHATKVRVRFGRPSVNMLEVLEGLQVGDRVILSDMGAYEQYDRVTLK
jgi:HlyD family secretion protein